MKKLCATILIAFGVCCPVIETGAITPDEFLRSEREKADEFLQRKSREADDYLEAERQRVKAFRDSLNNLYGDALSKKWDKFNLEEKKRGFDPIPPKEVEADVPKEDPRHQITPPKPIEPVAPVAVKPNEVKVDFYGEVYEFSKISFGDTRLSDTSEKEVANLWKRLSNMDFDEMIEGYEFLQKDLALEDWGNAMLVKSLVKAYFPDASHNSRIVIEAFMLNQVGYDAKIARDNTNLFLIMPFRQAVFNAPSFKLGNLSYYVIDPEHKGLTMVYMCRNEYYDGQMSFDVELRRLPRLQGGLESYAAFFSTYPCVSHSVYANAPLSDPMIELIATDIYPMVDGLDTIGTINTLLDYIQKFPYKTDQANYGYEKWNFAEESMLEPFTDCDDRAILFSQLARTILDLDVMLVHYPGRHLAAAVDLGDSNRGDCVTYKGRTFTICDPTYTGAVAGMEMETLANHPKELIPLK